MRHVWLLVCLFLSSTTYGQIVYKSDFERAIERMGTVYSVTQQIVGEFSFQSIAMSNTKMTCVLETFECADTGERVQGVSVQFGANVLTCVIVQLNCSEIDNLIAAANQIKDNPSLRYVSKTANLRLFGYEKNPQYIRIDVPAEGSRPGDFAFKIQGFVRPEEFVKMLQAVKSMAD